MDAHRPVIMGTRHAIASGHYFASQAGFEILNGGGNAIDAGVTAGLAIGVLQSEFVNIAGIAPIMIRLAGSDTVITIDGVGVWPRSVRPEIFIEGNNEHIPEGIQRTLTPGAPGSWLYALEKYGTMRFIVAQADAHAKVEFLSQKDRHRRAKPSTATTSTPAHTLPPRRGTSGVSSASGR